MDEQELATELLPFAVSVARQYTRDDIEAHSIAGWALLRAIRSYNWWKCPDGLRGYVAYCVRTDVFHWKRKVKVRAHVKCSEFIAEYASCEDTYTEDVLTEFEWWLLICKYELRWPHDVVARRCGLSVYATRKHIAEAIRKLQEVV